MDKLLKLAVLIAQNFQNICMNPFILKKFNFNHACLQSHTRVPVMLIALKYVLECLTD